MTTGTKWWLYIRLCCCCCCCDWLIGPSESRVAAHGHTLTNTRGIRTGPSQKCNSTLRKSKKKLSICKIKISQSYFYTDLKKGRKGGLAQIRFCWRGNGQKIWKINSPSRSAFEHVWMLYRIVKLTHLWQRLKTYTYIHRLLVNYKVDFCPSYVSALYVQGIQLRAYSYLALALMYLYVFRSGPSQ